MYITDHWNTLVPDTATIARESQVLQQRVMDAGRFRVIPSSCNFFLVQTLGGTARQLQDYLATTHGLLIRDGSNFKGLDNSYFRLAIQRPEMNDLLVHGLHTWRYS
jgi:threonine-phosphate decarboxylase